MNLLERIQLNAHRHAQRVAYVYEGRERTFAQLVQDIEHCAGALQKRGLGPKDKVALLLPNSEEFLICYYAIIGLGAMVVPINPAYSAQEIEFILKDAQVKAIVAMGQIAELILKKAEVIPAINNLQIFTTHLPVPNLASVTDLIAQGHKPSNWPEIQADHGAVILYTSGTTGNPKGAILSHKNLITNVLSTGEHINFSAEDSTIAVLPMFHVFCMTVCMNMAMIHGAKLVILPRFTPKEVVMTIKEHAIRVFVGVPTMYTKLLNLPEMKKENLQSLKFCVSGGSALPVTLFEAYQKQLGLKIIEGYGLSEASPVCSFNPIAKQKAGSIGVPLAGVEMKIVGDDGQEVPAGQIGEIVVKGPNVMKEYYNRPDATAETIKDGWLFTGDLGTQDDEGYFYVVDRKKDLIIVGGYNVYPREVEEVVYRMPQVAEVAVVGSQCDVYGEAVRCFIKLKEGDNVSTEEVKEFCTQHLAKYKVPKETVVMADLPKNSTGKILRRLLREI